MSKSAWFKIFYSLFDNPIWDDKPFARGQAWIDILRRVNWSDEPVVKWERGIKIEVPRGCFIASEKELAGAWGWSRTKTRLYVESLKKEHQIKHQNEHQKIKVSYVFSVVNWERYQQKKHQKKHQKEHQKNIKKTSDSAVYKEYIYNTDVKVIEEREEVEEGGAKKMRRAITMPDGFSFNDGHMALAQKRGFSPAQVSEMFEHFKAYCERDHKTYKNWTAAFTNWICQQKKYGGKNVDGTKHHPSTGRTADYYRQGFELQKDMGAGRSQAGGNDAGGTDELPFLT